MSSGKRHPKTREIVMSYLLGKGHKEVAREHDVSYTTCVDISKRYVSWVPVLKRPLPFEQKELDLVLK